MVEDEEKKLRDKIKAALSADVGKSSIETVKRMGSAINDPLKNIRAAGKRAAKSVDKGTETYIPTFRKMAASAAAVGAGVAGRTKEKVLAIKFDASTTMFLYILVFFMYAFDWFVTGFDGIKFMGTYATLWTTLQGVLLDKSAWFVIILLSALNFRFNLWGVREFISTAVLVYTIFLILLCGGLNAGVMHLVIPLIFFVTIIRKNMDVAKGNLLFAALLIFDFFGYGLLDKFFPGNLFITNRLIFPLWFYFVFIYTIGGKKNLLTSLMIFLVFSLNVYALVGAYDVSQAYVKGEYLTPEKKEAAIGYFKSGINNMVGAIRSIPTKFRQTYEQGMRDATGGQLYAEGGGEQTDKPLTEPAGVFITNTRASRDEYKKNQPVHIYSYLSVNTPKEFDLAVKCVKGESDSGKHGEIEPNDGMFKVDGSEEKSLMCAFPDGFDNDAKINLFAEFDFKTDADLMVFFMDYDEKRLYQKKSKKNPAIKHPLEENWGKDVKKTPYSIYRPTDGPMEIKIGIGTKGKSAIEFPIGVSQDEIEHGWVNFVIKNLWNGEITNIKELKFYVPKGIKLKKERDGICNGLFKEGGETSDGKFTVYMIEEKAGQEAFGLPEKPIEKWKSKEVLCQIDVENINIDELFREGDGRKKKKVPLRYFKVFVNYNYKVKGDKTIVVKVKDKESSGDIQKKELTSCTDPCDSDNGCKCNNEKCKSHGMEIAKGKKCGGLKEVGTSGGSDPTGPPTNLDIKINGGAATTYNLDVILTLSSDNAQECRFKNHGGSWSNYEAYSTQKKWGLFEYDNRPGPRVVYYQCKNNVGESIEHDASDIIDYQLYDEAGDLPK